MIYDFPDSLLEIELTRRFAEKKNTALSLACVNISLRITKLASVSSFQLTLCQTRLCDCIKRDSSVLSATFETKSYHK